MARVAVTALRWLRAYLHAVTALRWLRAYLHAVTALRWLRAYFALRWAGYEPTLAR